MRARCTVYNFRGAITVDDRAAGARPHPKKPAVSERAQQEARRQAGKTAQQEAREFQQAQQAADGGGLDLAGTRRRAGALASAFFEELE